MPKLFIHIGSPKTGSTAIQYFLAQNLEALDAQGVNFVRQGRKRDAHNLILQARRAGDIGKVMQKVVREIQSRPDDTHVLTSEMYFGAGVGADLAAALGIDVAVVAPNAASDSHERVILRLRRDRLERFGDSFDGLCVVFFTRVLRGRVDLNGRGSLSPPASLVRRPAGTALRTWRSDPPHRSQSRLPANYAGELKRRYRIA